MQSVFLSFPFDATGREMAGQVERLLRSHNLRVLHGKRLGGGMITPEVKIRIAEADVFVALMMRDRSLGKDAAGVEEWTTSTWVQNELVFAREKDKRAVALVETGVRPEGAYSEHERIPLVSATPLEAFLDLSETISIWREELGRMVRVRLKPPEVEALETEGPDAAVCEYRLRNQRDNACTDWCKVSVFPDPGGKIFHARVAREDQLMQVRFVKDGGREVWMSNFEPYQLHATLERRTPGA